MCMCACVRVYWRTGGVNLSSEFNLDFDYTNVKRSESLIMRVGPKSIAKESSRPTYSSI